MANEGAHDGAGALDHAEDAELGTLEQMEQLLAGDNGAGPSVAPADKPTNGATCDPDYHPPGANTGRGGSRKGAPKSAVNKKGPPVLKKGVIDLEDLDDVSGKAPPKAKRQRVNYRDSMTARAVADALNDRDVSGDRVRFL